MNVIGKIWVHTVGLLIWRFWASASKDSTNHFSCVWICRCRTCGYRGLIRGLKHLQTWVSVGVLEPVPSGYQGTTVLCASPVLWASTWYSGLHTQHPYPSLPCYWDADLIQEFIPSPESPICFSKTLFLWGEAYHSSISFAQDWFRLGCETKLWPMKLEEKSDREPPLTLFFFLWTALFLNSNTKAAVTILLPTREQIYHRLTEQRGGKNLGLQRHCRLDHL